VKPETAHMSESTSSAIELFSRVTIEGDTRTICVAA